MPSISGLFVGSMSSRIISSSVCVNALSGPRSPSSVQPGRIHLVPEALVHAPETQYPQGAGIRIRLHCLGAVFANGGLEVLGDGVQHLIPGDALELGTGSTRSHALVRIHHAIVVVG